MHDDHPPHHETIALAAERLRVDRVERITGRVRIGVTTEIVDEPLTADLSRTEMRVETIPIDRTLEPGEAPPVQSMQGDTIIIPILEEIVVVEKRLVLRAEIHVTPVTSSEPLSTSVPLRRQVATIDRAAADGSVTGQDPAIPSSED